MATEGETTYLVQQSDPLSGMFRMLQGGLWTYLPNSTSIGPRPSLDGLAITATISGTATLHWHTHAVLQHTKSVMVLLPGACFDETVHDQPWTTCWIVLWGPLQERFRHIASASATHGVWAIDPCPATIRLALQNCADLVRTQDDLWQWNFLAQIGRVVTSLIEHSTHHRSPSMTSRVLHIMEQNLDTPLTLDQIAERVGVSLSTLSHDFRRQMQTTPARQYRYMRIERAEQLLINGLSVGEVSDQMGFKNQFHFSRVFRMVRGISPTEYLRQKQIQSLRSLQR